MKGINLPWAHPFSSLQNQKEMERILFPFFFSLANQTNILFTFPFFFSLLFPFFSLPSPSFLPNIALNYFLYLILFFNFINPKFKENIIYFLNIQIKGNYFLKVNPPSPLPYIRTFLRSHTVVCISFWKVNIYSKMARGVNKIRGRLYMPRFM